MDDSQFKEGAKAALPIVFGYLPVGIAFGVLARKAGLSPIEAGSMSLFVYAGASQFIAVEMISKGVPWGTIVLTTFFINLRHLLMGASVAPHLRGQPGRWKALLAFGLTDESYALAISRYLAGDGSREFFLGANFGLYAGWNLSTLAGAVLGGLVVAFA